MTTRLSDLIVPEIFTPYAQNRTAEKSRLVVSGAMVVDSTLSAHLNGAGLTFNEPSFKDLANDDENISTDDPAQMSTPKKIGTLQEVQVRISRNQSWSSMDLNSALIGADPMQAIGNLVSDYWLRRKQALFIATMKGIYANNAAATDAYHVQNDMTFSLAALNGAAFSNGVTNFSASAFLDACQTMGDSQQDLSLVFVHSVVYNRMSKNNLIDFIPDSEGRVTIPTYLGRIVVVDDAMPNTGGLFDTWIFGGGSLRWGQGSPAVPTEVDRVAAAGNGSGQEILHNRVEWAIAPVGFAYVGSPAAGGPSNAATANNFGAAASWQRVFPERKQIKMARLITREF